MREPPSPNPFWLIVSFMKLQTCLRILVISRTDKELSSKAPRNLADFIFKNFVRGTALLYNIIATGPIMSPPAQTHEIFRTHSVSEAPISTGGVSSKRGFQIFDSNHGSTRSRLKSPSHLYPVPYPFPTPSKTTRTAPFPKRKQ